MDISCIAYEKVDKRQRQTGCRAGRHSERQRSDETRTQNRERGERTWKAGFVMMGVNRSLAPDGNCFDL